MSSEDSTPIISHRLNGSNFKLWKFQITAILRGKGLIEIVGGTETAPDPADSRYKDWIKKDGQAMAILFSSLDSTQANHVLTCKTSNEIVLKLESIHNKTSDVRIMTLYEEYFAIKMDENESVTSYVSNVTRLAAEIEEHKEKLSDNLKMCRIISGLSSKFNHFKTVWYNIKECRSIDTLLAKLQLEEDQMNKHDKAENSGDAAFNVKHQNKRKKDFGIKKKSKSTCFSCGKEGHWKKDCPDKQKQHQTKDKSENKSSAAFSAMTEILSASYNDVWLADSGASKHMTFRKDWFCEFSSNECQAGIKVANNEIMHVEGSGAIEIEACINGKWHKKRLENVLFVPKSKVNLFSIGSLMNKGFEINFEQKRCIITTEGETVAVGHKDENNLVRMIFRHDATSNKHVDACLAANGCSGESLNSLQQWHRRLGHMNANTIKSMIKQNMVCGISLSNLNEFFCKECQIGKMHRSSHPLKEKRVIEKGECFHVDLCGKMQQVGVGGAQYFMLLKDEATGFRFAYLIAHKSEVEERFKEFLALIKNSTKYSVKRIRCDNGTEFINQNLTKHFSKQGIVFERISPYTPEQNGYIERDNRTVQEYARTMLLESGLSKSLWPEAVRTAVYMLNRSPNSKNPEITAYENWFGEKPQLGHVKVFGTIGYAHIPKIARKKWDQKAKEVHLVGYEPTQKNYRLYDSASGKVIVSCDVKFNENFIRSEYFDCSNDDGEVENDQTLVNDSNTLNEHFTSATETSLEHSTKKDCAGDIENGNHSINMDCAGSNKDNINSVNGIDIGNHSTPVVRRSERNRKPPKRFDEYEMYSHLACLTDEPLCYEDAMKSKNSNEWKAAIEDELKSLHENETFEVVNKPKHCNVIGNKWVFKLKTMHDEQPKFKARLVAKGYAQHHGVDYTETFSPVVRYDSVRCVLAVAAIQDMEMVQFDVKTAFLNGELKEEIYMKVPEGIDHEDGQVCRLKRSLYGLKQASRAWNSKFVEFLTSCSLIQSKADPCVFYGDIDDNKVIVLLYVDDGLILSHSMQVIESLVDKLKGAFKITLGNNDYYVGMEIKRNRDLKTITIGQESYVKKVVEKFCMSESKSISTPFDIGTVLKKSGDESTVDFPYRQACGSLMYAATVSRPDISYAVGEISRFMQNPNHEHVNAVKRILRYLNHTKSMGIMYGLKGDNEISLIGYTDADYARDIESRRSTTGYAFKIGDGVVTWKSQRQKTVALSTTEAEYMAVCDGAKEAVWLRQLLKDIGCEQVGATQLFVDNQSAIRLVRNPEMHHKTKHIDVRLHFIRNLNEENVIDVEYIQTEKQLADCFTKPLSTSTFKSNIIGLGLSKMD